MHIVKGMPVGRDGRVRTTLSINPSTLRFASSNPNMQTAPRASKENPWPGLVKHMFVAPAGYALWELDFSAIEAVLVGYFANSARYIRSAKLGVHAFLASHIINKPASFEWADTDIKAYFKTIKREHSDSYDVAKRIVHSSNYLATPRHIHNLYPEIFPTIKSAAALQEMYFGLFPEIPAWHKDLCLRVDASRQRKAEPGAAPPDPWTLGVAYAKNPFGYAHRFYHVLDWEKIENEWVWHLGDDAKRLIAFLPQSTAAGILRRALRTLWYDYPWVGETFRLIIHDAILGECRVDQLDEYVEIVRRVMEAPIPELPLDPSWGLGEFLTIGCESKKGTCWGDMH